jgi:hypothetical protein
MERRSCGRSARERSRAFESCDGILVRADLVRRLARSAWFGASGGCSHKIQHRVEGATRESARALTRGVVHHERLNAKVWQIAARGEGFVRNGLVGSFALTGFVRGVDANDAWERAIAIARSRWIEIAQSDGEGVPRAVINVDEIEDASRLQLDPALIDEVEVLWEGDDG